MDFCKKCKALHQARVRNLNQGKGANQMVREIEDLTEKECENPDCALHPNNLWKRKPVEVRITEVHSCPEGDLLTRTTVMRV